MMTRSFFLSSRCIWGTIPGPAGTALDERQLGKGQKPHLQTVNLSQEHIFISFSDDSRYQSEQGILVAMLGREKMDQSEQLENMKIMIYIIQGTDILMSMTHCEMLVSNSVETLARSQCAAVSVEIGIAYFLFRGHVVESSPTQFWNTCWNIWHYCLQCIKYSFRFLVFGLFLSTCCDKTDGSFGVLSAKSLACLGQGSPFCCANCHAFWRLLLKISMLQSDPKLASGSAT